MQHVLDLLLDLAIQPKAATKINTTPDSNKRIPSEIGAILALLI